MISKTLNIRSQDRANVSRNSFDPNVKLSNCTYNLDTPISLKSDGVVGLRSAFFPITFKHVDKTNDRFAIRFLPAQATARADCVYAMLQLQHGYYNSSTAVKNEVNRLLGLLDATIGGERASVALTDDEGGIVNQYSSETDAILSNNMTCTLGTGDTDKDHLIFTLPDGVVLSNAAHKASGNATGATDLVGGFQILFGDAATDSPTVLQQGGVAGRSASRVLGFGDAYNLPITAGTSDFVGFPAVALRGGSNAAQVVNAQFLSNVLRTPYIYVRSNLCRESRETRKFGAPTDLLAKIPVSSTTYGSTVFYEPTNAATIRFRLPAGDINNINIVLTDGDGVELDFDANNYELMLQFSGDFYN